MWAAEPEPERSLEAAIVLRFNKTIERMEGLNTSGMFLGRCLQKHGRYGKKGSNGGFFKTAFKHFLFSNKL